MASNMNNLPTKLLWIDLEMTGLEPESDLLLEVAAEITDFNLKTLDSYEARFKQDRTQVLERMQTNIWWRDFPANRDEFVQKLDEGLPADEIEQQLVSLVQKHFKDEPAVLAGNSIYNDRKFITKYLPTLELSLHYRMLDVSAWKVFMQGRFGVNYEKKDVHRAFDDIQASIAELQFYLDWFKNQDNL